MISVIIPIYNPGDSLCNCLNSVLNQTYKDLEIICINDGSTDNSKHILAEFAKKDNRIIIVEQANQGVSCARNNGLNVASGEYVSFIDSDDELDLDMYKTLIEFISSNNNVCDIIHCGYRRIKPDGSYTDINGTNKIYNHNREDALIHLISGTLFNGGLWNKLFRRDLLNGIRFLPSLKINEDVLFCFQAFYNSKSSVFYDKPLYYYHESPTSTCSTTKHLKKALDCTEVSRIIYETCLNTNLSTYAAERYYHTACNTYRSYIFSDIKNSKNERKALSSTIKALERQICNISIKHKFNYALMRYFPRSYRTLYKIYDAYRTPNWDVKQ